MRQRVRPAYSSGELAGIYSKPHDHSRWSDHVVRAEATIALCRWFSDVRTVADLSCGDGWIAKQVAHNLGATVVLGDIAASYEHHGPLEQTIHDIEPMDLFICTETLEHVDDPDAVLAQIREKTRFLVVSTPDAEPFDGDPSHFNPEHYWTWDSEGLKAMLEAAGFSIEAGMQLQMPSLNVRYQLWACS